MAKQETFKVSQRGVEPVVVNFNKPESLDDSQWETLGVSKEQISELAAQNLVIKIQGVARGKLSEGADAVQKAVDEYKYGQRSSGGTRKASVKLSKDQTKQAKFSKEQLAMLKEAGVDIEGMEEEAKAA